MTYLFWENLLFFCGSTLFCFIVGWAWKDLKPFTLLKPLPSWFKFWFIPVQIIGLALPFLALIFWGFVSKNLSIIMILTSYLGMLILQIISESIALKKFQSVTFVMIPYLYLPYRFWQLYQSLKLLSPEPELMGIRYLLILNLMIWIINYLLDLSQLPFLLRWAKINPQSMSEDPTKDDNNTSEGDPPYGIPR